VVQEAWNAEHGVVPKTVSTKVRDLLAQAQITQKPKRGTRQQRAGRDETLRGRFVELSIEELTLLAEQRETEMLAAAENLAFERAAELRDELEEVMNEIASRGESA
jgi:excinuclease ABC subunit B